ncbi:SPC25 Probable kinetochore protein SPC25 [Candida maltosa Xu316]
MRVLEEIETRAKNDDFKIIEKLSKKEVLLRQQEQEHKQEVENLNNQKVQLDDRLDSLKQNKEVTKTKLNEALSSLSQQKSNINELVDRKDELNKIGSELESDIAKLNKAISEGMQELTKSNDNMSSQIDQTLPELQKYEKYTGLKISAITSQLICFIFFNLDPNNYDREFKIELDLSGSEIKVEKSDPELSEDKVKVLTDEFNKTKNLGRFLKEIRNLFKDFVSY